MNPTHLHSFISIADHGSFSKAAKIMHISTQALLQQIDILERVVGAPIFDRNHKGVVLTNAGELLYDGAKHILSYSEDLLERCKQTQSKDKVLHIGTSNEITPTFLYQIAFEFKSVYPQIVLNTVYTDSYTKFADLMDAKLDMCESFFIPVIKQYKLEFFSVLESCPYCIVSKSHPLAAKEVIRPGDLEGQTIMLNTSQTDQYGNELIAPPLNGITYKRYHNLTNRKLETASGHAVYFDYLLDPLDADVFEAIPYETVPHKFGFVYNPNPGATVQRFLEIAEKYKDIHRFSEQVDRCK